MKKTIITTIIAVLLCGQTNLVFSQVSSSIDCSKLPKNPTPHSAVNDFANIIDEANQTVIENKLRSYWDSTSIAICVVTIPTLEEYDQFDYSYSLFNCWGIGGKDDRGVLLFISLKERKISIRTGRGIEPFLTDANSARITGDIKPYFRQINYGEGIANGVDGIISILGKMSWADRLDGAQRRKDAEEKEISKLKDNIMDFIFFFLVTVLIVYIAYRIKKARKKARLVNTIKERIKQATDEIKKAIELLEQSAKSFNQSPSWAKKEAEGYIDVCKQGISQASDRLDKAHASIESDVQYADQISRESLMIIEKAFKSFIKLNEDLKEKIKKIEVETPVKVAGAKKIVADNIVKLLKYMESSNKGNTIIPGYRFNKFLEEQKQFEAMLVKHESRLSDKDALSKIYTDSGIIQEKSNSLMSEIKAIIERKTSIDQGLYQLIQRGLELFSHKNDWDGLIAECNLKYPKNVCSDIGIKLAKATDKLSTEKLTAVQGEIIALNSMNSQEFDSAFVKYDNLSTLVTDTESAYTSLKNIVSEQQKSKDSHPSMYQKTKNIVEKSLDKVKDSDVSSNTRNIAKEASQKLRDAKIESEKSIVDWIALIDLLVVIEQLAEKAITKAKNEIEEAEDERRREAQRARSRQEESSYVSSFVSYNSGSSDSGSGSFGGFGGGSSGGGGSDSSW